MPDPSQILSISQLTRKIRMMLEIQIGEIWVEGEISNFREQKSGHNYFTLKDASAQLACVFFRGAAAKSKVVIRDGLMVRAYGEISVYEAQGKYQMLVAKLEESGEGALQAKFEALKRRLDAEGLFAKERKLAIPTFPVTIGIVTSPTGAALRDMINILQRRAPWLHIIVAPTRVQGVGAENEIADAIALLNRESGKSIPNIDTIIVGRGGGSIEDLWCFNEEAVARAIAASSIPIISAVGHEIDFTIADFAADLRAPTPSAAAELVAPDQEALRRHLVSLGGKLQGIPLRKIEYLEKLLASRSRESLRRGPEFAMREARQRLDSVAENLSTSCADAISSHQRRIERAAGILSAARPDRILDFASQRLNNLSLRLDNATLRRVEMKGQRVLGLSALLKSLGPESVLNRGYTITLGADGKPLRRVADVKAGETIVTRLTDGELRSRVE